MVLLLHDFSDFWYGWRNQVSACAMDCPELYCNNQLRGLSGSNWVVAPDLKGFGDSDKPFLARQYSDSVVVEELGQLVDALQVSDPKVTTAKYIEKPG
jgi:soluble epoxide hydrolase/lipid-phosphate phosphatase